MRPARALWVYLFFVFAGAAFISPGIYKLCVAAGLPGVPFRRVVDRCLIVMALAGLWPFLRALGIRSVGEIGLRTYPGIRRDIGAGVAIGSVLLLAAAGASLAMRVTEMQSRAGWTGQIGSALGTALSVALLEEILFRGAIFTALTRVWGGAAGLWVSSGLYAILHFFSRPENPATVEWNSGFVVLGRMMKGFTDFHTVIPGFLGLTLLGVILALAYRRTGALFMSMAIHGPIVFWVKLFGFAVKAGPDANTWFWGTPKLIDGWFAFFLLIAATLWFARKRKQVA
jgi:membrane protease YdiL (CAAX protease family)